MTDRSQPTSYVPFSSEPSEAPRRLLGGISSRHPVTKNSRSPVSDNGGQVVPVLFISSLSDFQHLQPKPHHGVTLSSSIWISVGWYYKVNICRDACYFYGLYCKIDTFKSVVFYAIYRTNCGDLRSVQNFSTPLPMKKCRRMNGVFHAFPMLHLLWGVVPRAVVVSRESFCRRNWVGFGRFRCKEGGGQVRRTSK